MNRFKPDPDPDLEGGDDFDGDNVDGDDDGLRAGPFLGLRI